MTSFRADEYPVIDPGVKQATFDGTEDTPEPGPYGPTIDFNFTVTTADGPVQLSGRASRPVRFTRSTKARQWTEAILGRPLARDETIDMSSLVGTPVLLTIIVKETDQGDFNRIVGIRRAGTGTVAPAHEHPQPVIDAEYQAYLASRDVDANGHRELRPPSEPPAGFRPDDET